MSDTTTIREALESAVPADEPIDAPALEPSPTLEVDVPAEPVAKSTASVADAQQGELPLEGAKSRDNKGRFRKAKTEMEQAVEAPQEALTAAPAQEGITPGPKSEPRSNDRAPASWRPDVREHWASLPAEVRAEVARRESETQRALAETVEARRFTEQLQNVIRPYEMFIKAENSNPLQAIDNLMATAARLRTAPAPDLAQMVAGIVKQFGVGRFGQTFIEQLDSALAGEIPRQDPAAAQLQQVVQQQLAPVQQFMSQFQQAQYAQQQRAQESAAVEVQQFLTQAEFGEDVREDMADLLEVAQRRGREISLQDAYRQACLANPRVRSVLEARAKAKGAQQLTGAAQKAKAAAVSVSGGPAPNGPRAEPNDVRSAIEAAIAANAR